MTPSYWPLLFGEKQEPKQSDEELLAKIRSLRRIRQRERAHEKSEAAIEG
jgi:hypothetical protein